MAPASSSLMKQLGPQGPRFFELHGAGDLRSSSNHRLPRVGEYRAIRPLELMQVLKGAYGLTEGPRLWHLEAKDGMAMAK